MAFRPSESERKANCTNLYLVYKRTEDMDRRRNSTLTLRADDLQAVFLRQTDAENFILLWLDDIQDEIEAEKNDISLYVQDVSLGDQKQYIGQPNFGEEFKMPLPISMIHKKPNEWWELTERDGANRLNNSLTGTLGTIINEQSFVQGYVDESPEYESCLPMYVVYGMKFVSRKHTTGRDDTLRIHVHKSLYDYVGGIYITLDEAKARATFMMKKEPGLFEYVKVIAVNRMTIPNDRDTRHIVWRMNGIDDINVTHGEAYELVLRGSAYELVVTPR